jgi:hypothetical protein
MEWMGLTECYDPGGAVPMPAYAAYFKVPPLSAAGNGEPRSYDGTLTLIVPGQKGNWTLPSDANKRTTMFTITAGGVSWKRANTAAVIAITATTIPAPGVAVSQ